MVSIEEQKRLRKIAGNMSEEGRKKALGDHEQTRKDIQEIIGTDIINHDKLLDIVEKIWLAVPASHKPNFTAEEWMEMINKRCMPALIRAESFLEENKVDDKMHIAKVKILRQTFQQQIVRAMHEVSEKYRKNFEGS